MAVFTQDKYNGVINTRHAREGCKQSKFPFDFTHLTRRELTGVISGTVALLYPPGDPETPISRRVTLFDRATMRPITSVWSDPTTGAYSFTNLNKTVPFLIAADDHTGAYNITGSDWVYAD